MEDRRIRKTKKALKETFVALLDEKNFEKITVTDICNKADTSRITFYTHYSDKYALAEDIFNDYKKIAQARFVTLQRENNPNNQSLQSYGNILTCVLEILFNEPKFFAHVSPDKNPYLSFIFYNIILRTVEHVTTIESHTHPLRYTPKQMTAFLCYGLAGFINESHNEGVSDTTIEEQSKKLLTDIVSSTIFVE